MSHHIKTVMHHLWDPVGLSESQVFHTMTRMLDRKIDYADIYFQSAAQESYVLDDGIIKNGRFHIEQGVGVRAIQGEKTGFAYSDDLQLSAIEQAASAAKWIAQEDRGAPACITSHRGTSAQYYDKSNIMGVYTAQEKIRILRTIDTLARQADPRVIQVSASLVVSYEQVLLLNSDGQWMADARPMVRLSVNVIVAQGQQRESGSMGGGGRIGYEIFCTSDTLARYAKEAVRQAVLNLDAKPAPAGIFPVVLGPGWPGVLLHEAVGHGLEGDFNRKGSSAFSGKIGQKVASELCTVVDDGTLQNRRGSLNMDDEGTPTQRTVLIEKGILKGYLQDKLNARLMGTVSTGNGRRESYASAPMPRMTNTFMLAGQDDPQDIIASVQDGIYAVNFGGGQVDITSGRFVFSATEAYRIEKGKITYPVKGATLIGSGPDIMHKIRRVGYDLALDEGIATCGKEGQSVPVGVGQPTLLVDGLTVGGTNA